ncbi:MAG: hypothetical protein A3G33_03170 [Omnitrophica bacterium RIFCSPLOWO2_12_FULL_44_17]|uniref:Glycosyltransferase 2-like domain-containing protein n=1 Tax=Candidatus Danuiimicrobium aquiferis TaxID=1801832 RepID=A0A1G1KTT2_9BACT|nr:MAG: hypothetical protein A3B72_06715 [Omnitrophica bacterium RIFCSPHIGHO2_02_FULL_45_28]OGW92210.1 MAG: hypothetical protein A3E74_03950 [Omnitrophica bacterium RIFCSPHIGHO2_12_FULL_44_12]OGW96320.1 MAG: hypothetical protein A3G33_03170 [Omnitrophica bacterium RIFCSPLOWO2_12_FULL_44_17]OGX04247.1 MAG: hypothetical protein A3J12_10865 [Omnitrophica bacterium RIFCSPLOWO2_02_FULL_44_11]
MDHHPLVSVVIATYNGAPYLSSQLKSILSQTYSNIEIIVTDDQSEDATVDIVREFAKSDQRIQIHINDKRFGYTLNFLRGLQQSRGEMVCFCDQDDAWRSDKIEQLLNSFLANNKLCLAFSDLEVCDEHLKIIHPSFFRLIKMNPTRKTTKEEAILKNRIPGCAMMFRKCVVDKLLRAIDGEVPLMHDHFVFLLASALGEIYFVDKPLVKYRQHRKNVTAILKKIEFNHTSFVESTERTIEYMKQHLSKELSIDYNRLIRFLELYEFRKGNHRIDYLNYFQCLRDDTAKDRLLAFLECVFPSCYMKLKNLFGVSI